MGEHKPPRINPEWFSLRFCLVTNKFCFLGEFVKYLARLWGNQGKNDQAAQMLQDIYDWFTEGFDTPMLVEAKRLLDSYL